MKKFFILFVTLVSISIFAQDGDGTITSPTPDNKNVEKPVGTIVPPTKKQLKSVKKPKKKKAVESN